MSYNYDSTGTLSATASNFKIASDALVSYTPDYQRLNIKGNGSDRGILYAGMTVDAGGYLDMGNRAYVSALTVLSGGTANGAGWGTWANVTVSSGGSIIFNATKLRGSDFNMAQGTVWVVSGNNFKHCEDAYVTDGMFHNMTIYLGIDAYDVKGFRDCTINAMLGIYEANVTVCNLTATGGKLYLQPYWSNIYLGGANTNITVGNFYNNADWYVTDGVFHNMNLRKDGSSLQHITLIEGLVAASPIVGDSGVLEVGSGGSASAATVTSNGNLYVLANGQARGATVSAGGKMYVSSAGAASATVVSDGGKMYVSYGGVTDGVTVLNGGSVTYVISSYYRPEIVNLVVSEGGVASAENYVMWKSLDVKEGGVFSCTGNVKISGTGINIAPGAWANCGSASVVNGEIRDYQGAKSFDVSAGAGIRGGEFGGYVSMMNSTTVLDAAVTAGGTMTVYSGATASGVQVRNGGLFVADSNSIVSAATISNGGVMKIYGNNAYTAPFFENITIENGGYLDMYAKARVSGLVIRSGGRMAPAGWASYKDITVESGGTFTFNAGKLYGNFNIAQGALTNCLTAYASDGIFYDFDTTQGFDVYDGVGFSGGRIGGNLSMTDTTKLYGVTLVNGGNAFLLSGAEAYGVKIENGGKVNASTGAVVDGLTVSNGGVFNLSAGASALGVEVSAGGLFSGFANAVVTGATISNGGVMKAAGNGDYTAPYYENVVIESGGTLDMSARARVSNLLVRSGGVVIPAGWGTWKDITAESGASVTFNAAKLSGTYDIAQGAITNCATAYASGKVFYDFDTNLSFDVFDGVGFSGGRFGGNLSMTSGTTLNDVTVVNGGTIFVYGGATATGVTVSNGGTVKYISSSTRPDLVDLVVESGGVASADAYCGWRSIDVKEGGTLSATNAKIHGTDINIAQGAWANYTSAYAVNGVIYDLDTTAGFDLFSGTVLSNAKLGGYTSLSLGAQARDVELTNANRGLTMSSGCYVYNVSATTGYLHLEDYSRNVSLGGAQTEIAAGHVRYNALGQSSATDNDLYATGGVLHNLVIRGEGQWVRNLTLIEGISADAPVVSGGTLSVASGATVTDAVALGGTLFVSSGGVLDGVTQSAGLVRLGSGAAVSRAVMSGGSMYLFDTPDMTGVERPMMTADDMTVSDGKLFLRGANVSGSGIDVHGGIMYVQNQAVAENVEIYGGNVSVYNQSNPLCVDYDKDGALISSVTVRGGATLQVESGGVVEAGTLASGATLNVYKGGQAGLSSVGAGATVNLSFWDVTSGGPGNTEALISDWGDFSSDAKVTVHSLETGYSYKIADTANANVTLNCGNYRIYDIAVKSGEEYSNAFWGVNFDFSDGMTLTTGSFTVGVQSAAAELTTATATVLADGGLATKWESTTDVSTLPAALAGADTTGDAWLTVDGADLATALYGAEGAFNHDVNMWLYEGTVRNLAAGATAGGSVENVNLLVSQEGEGNDKLAFTGVAYLGGFGTVNGAVKAAVYNGTFDKDVYAGALANKNTTNTTVGGIDLTIDGGLFKGNLYGASAVKTVDGTGSGVRNATGDVSLTVTDGTAAKSDFCCFAGGYATGTASGRVYTVDSVTATIAGGSWGGAHGGRGIFGGAMASGVEAAVLGEVNLTISGGSMGNVFGGGWAQKPGAKSIVGDVNITIAGTAQVANVFGGGSHSTSGGVTTAENVTITVSGGSITGDIYARGQLEGDSVTSAKVIFTGAEGFACGVYGYAVVGATDPSNATLSFSDYTGIFSGKLGGFNGITLDKDTAANFGAEAEISNTAWIFDAAERDASLNGTAFLNWDAADFASSTVTLNLATGDASEWTLINAETTTAYGTFTLQVDGDNVATGLVLGDTITGTGTAYDGWGFTRENDVLKFAQITA